MNETKLTVRVPRKLIEKVKRYAAQNQTTVTDLIEGYLETLPEVGALREAPIVQRLSGILSSNVTNDDYRNHLEEKYGR